MDKLNLGWFWSHKRFKYSHEITGKSLIQVIIRFQKSKELFEKFLTFIKLLLKFQFSLRQFRNFFFFRTDISSLRILISGCGFLSFRLLFSVTLYFCVALFRCFFGCFFLNEIFISILTCLLTWFFCFSSLFTFLTFLSFLTFLTMLSLLIELLIKLLIQNVFDFVVINFEVNIPDCDW